MQDRQCKACNGLGIEAEIASRQLERIARPAAGGEPPKKRTVKLIFVIKCYLSGAFKSRTKEKTTEKVEQFLKPFEIVDFTDKMSYEYAKIRKDLELAGTPIGANDLLVAAAAVHEKATLITHNTDEFSRVPDLEIEDWVKE